MAKPSKLVEIEKREGRPMADILIELYRQHGKQTTVAKALGVGQATVSQWLVRLGLQEKTILVARKREEVRIIDDRPQIAAAQLPSIQRAE